MKNTLKKLFVIFVLVLTVLAFAACGKDEKDNKDEDDKKTEKSEKSNKDDDDDNGKKSDDNDDDDEDDDNNKNPFSDDNETTPEPTADPTAEPTVEPTAEPTAEPTVEPTAEPTAEPTVEPTAEPTAEPTVEPTTEPTAEPTAEPTTAPDFDNGELTGVYKLVSLYSRGSNLVSAENIATFENAGIFYGSLEVKDDGTAVLRFEENIRQLNYDDTSFYDDTDSMTYEISDTNLVLTSAVQKIIATFEKMDAAELEKFGMISSLDADQYAQLFGQVVTNITVVTPEPTTVPDNTGIDVSEWEGSYKVVSLKTSGMETMTETVLSLLESKGLTVGIVEVNANGVVTISLLGTEFSGTFDGVNVTVNGVTVPIVFEGDTVKLEQNGQSIEFKKMAPEEVGSLRVATTTELYSLF